MLSIELYLEGEFYTWSMDIGPSEEFSINVILLHKFYAPKLFWSNFLKNEIDSIALYN